MDVKFTDRQALILSRVRETGSVAVAALAQDCGVSEMTIRRDLEALEGSGVVRRVHGGAVTGWNRGYEPAFSQRAAQNGDAKARIGRRCADLIEEGETLFLDIGTTTLAAAHALAGRRGITVITPNLRAADILVDNPGIRVICLGGVVRTGERCVTGVIAERNLAEFFFDTCIVGVAGVSLQAGLTEFNVDDASLKRTAIDHGRRIIALADSSKLGQIALATVAPLSRISTLITDADEKNEIVVGTRKAGATVELV